MYYVGFEVLTAANMKVAVFWVIALMTEASSISKTLLNFHQTTWHSNPEDSHLQIICRHLIHIQEVLQADCHLAVQEIPRI
jgi:hypothetical protein